MKLRYAVRVITILAVACMPTLAADSMVSSEDRLDGVKIQLARYAKAYIGQGNVTVEVAPYKMGDKDGALLLIKGVESPWDERVVNHEIQSGGRDYAARYKGKSWVTMTVRNGKYTLYVPEVKDEIALAPSDGAAQLTSPQAIFQKYLEQQRGPKIPH